MAKVSLEQLALTDARLCVYQRVCGGRNAGMPNGRAEMVIKIFEKLTHTHTKPTSGPWAHVVGYPGQDSI